MIDRCDLRCHYCYQGDYKEDRRSLDPEFARAGIDKYLGEGPRQTDRLRFYRVGEPTLAFDLIRELYDYARKVYPKVRCELQTNGYWARNGVYDEAMAQWIASHLDLVWISYDGLTDIQDRQRPTVEGNGSSEMVERSISLLVESRARVGVRPTVTEAAMERMVEIVENCHAMGVDYLYFHPVIKQQGKSIQMSGDTIYDVDLMAFARLYVDAWKRAQELGTFCGNWLTMNFDEPTTHFCKTCLGAPHLTLDGYVSACDKAFYGTGERFRSLIIGRYDRETGQIIEFPERLEAIRSRTPENMTPCSKCPISSQCGGSCLGEANFLYGDIFKRVPTYCQAVKFLAKRIPRNRELFPVTHP